MEDKYNFIYEKLVSSEDDLVGLIAYGIYKKHKIEFITNIKEECQREPLSEECRSFFVASTTPSQLEKYRNQAETMLSEMVGNIAQSELSQYEVTMLKNYKKELSSCIPSNWSTFGLSVLSGILSAFLFAVIAGIFYFIGETSDKSTQEQTREIMKNIQEFNTQDSTKDTLNTYFN